MSNVLWSISEPSFAKAQAIGMLIACVNINRKVRKTLTAFKKKPPVIIH